MTGFFNTVALNASNSNVAEVADGTAALIWWLLIGIAVAISWLAFFDNHWTAYAENPTKLARREMKIAIFAPITVPILAAMLIVKTVRGVKSVTV
jgi:hypothetical protein